MILACGCRGNGGVTAAAVFQDEAYGPGMRAHTPTAKEDFFRCTVCNAEHKKPGKQLSKKELKAIKEAERAEKHEKKLANGRRR